jgi:hypothetical protein
VSSKSRRRSPRSAKQRNSNLDNLRQLPPTGPNCLCCRGKGVLPPARINGEPVGLPGMVDGPTLLQCCEPCITALAFGGSHAHPHPCDVGRILGGITN